MRRKKIKPCNSDKETDSREGGYWSGTYMSGLLPLGIELVPDSGHFMVFFSPLSGLLQRVGEHLFLPQAPPEGQGL